MLAFFCITRLHRVDAFLLILLRGLDESIRRMPFLFRLVSSLLALGFLLVLGFFVAVLILPLGILRFLSFILLSSPKLSAQGLIFIPAEFFPGLCERTRIPFDLRHLGINPGIMRIALNRGFCCLLSRQASFTSIAVRLI